MGPDNAPNILFSSYGPGQEQTKGTSIENILLQTEESASDLKLLVLNILNY